MKRVFRIGVDEAGRGPRAGPVVACAFGVESLSSGKGKVFKDFGITDSKKLTEKKRLEIFKKLVSLSNKKDSDFFFEIGIVDSYQIDQLGIKKANQLAMQRALDLLLKKIIKLPEQDEVDTILIDGNDNYKFENLPKKPIFVVEGDSKILEIGAASILAKVFRDKLLSLYGEIYPNFSFENHKGYGTKKHQENLENFGTNSIHRTSFSPVKKISEKKEKLVLHVCCGPDLITPILRLKDKFDLVCYWYDPNVFPKKEHDKRLFEFKKICKKERIEFVVGPYDSENFLKKIKPVCNTGEGKEQCTACYDFRLSKAASFAKEIGAYAFTTTLNCSPKKSFEKLEKIGFSLEKKFGIRYYSIDFKKNDGDLLAVNYCKENKIYRQNYCGCVYSETYPTKLDFMKLPKFSLPASDGKTYTNETLPSKAVLFLYPKDLTPGCTKESCAFRDLRSQFKKQGFEIFGLSKDSLKSHTKFIEKESLNFPLLSDEETILIQALDAWKEKSMFGKKYFGTERSTFVILNGEIVKEWRKVKVPGHVDEVLEFCKQV